ncbi:hypothetical protein [Cytobacillus solani]|uniref:Uncharacterized protein n=1 Tax=Cytobacillus solani TaxID=1637975 RepID=A0A0Q3SG80_9BACI|nr:hypothetical protein [Cytobacillus solani]KQL18372.1 hypothetical protein AN957_07155 [Cytobacillus solani]
MNAIFLHFCGEDLLLLGWFTEVKYWISIFSYALPNLANLGLSRAMQLSQYEFILEKGPNWMILE